MRTVSAIDQEERKRKLLQAIIHQHIKTGKPVGSAFLASQKRLDLSPASLRNIMGELEKEGYLTHPHTSAGRVPTDKAYRFYVDSLADLQRLALKEEERIRQEYEARAQEVNEILRATSKTLSVLSQYSGFITPPAVDQSRLQHVELISLESRRVLAVLVSDTGVVKHRQVVFDREYPDGMLDELTRLLNQRLRGQPFSEVRESLIEHIEAVHQRQIDLMHMAAALSRQAFDMGAEDFYVEGAGNILALPDFSGVAELQNLVHLLDERRTLGKMIVDDLAQAGTTAKFPGVKVKIGSENLSPGLRNLSLISSTYTVNGRQVGVLGIIGPRRMEYSRMISLVNHVAQAMTRTLGRMLGEK